MLEDHVMRDMSLVRTAELERPGTRARRDYDSAAAEEASSRKKPNRVFCRDRVDSAVGHRNHGLHVLDPSIVLKYYALGGDAHEPATAALQVEDRFDLFSRQ